METGKKKPSVVLFLLGSFLAGCLGYLIGGVWQEGMVFATFLPAFLEVCNNPFANHFSEYTVRCIVAVWFIYVLIMVMYYTSQRNLMPGKEYGTARFEKPARVNKMLADKEENFNRILSKHVKMSMNFRELKLNGNTLICGGSGAGKTFYWVKPNMMQMPQKCSFVSTDPKGEIVRAVAPLLKANGYNVKVINLVEMDKSDCYNPFAYNGCGQIDFKSDSQYHSQRCQKFRPVLGKIGSIILAVYLLLCMAGNAAFTEKFCYGIKTAWLCGGSRGRQKIQADRNYGRTCKKLRAW